MAKAAEPRKAPRSPTRTARKLWHPPSYEAADVHAVQALARGEAGPAEQKRALDWIINRAAQTYEEPFFPDNARVTDYVLGRRSVGLALVKLVRLKPGLVAEKGE